jgi:Glucose/sorbosone dehydrogenases
MDVLAAQHGTRQISSISLTTLLTVAIYFLTPTLAPGQLPLGASVLTKVQVPTSMRSAPFNTDRYLKVPPNFSIAVYARLRGARFMAIAPNGDLVVSRPKAGKVILVRPNNAGDPLISTFVAGLRKPHDLVFHAINDTTYLYIAESHQIQRCVYNIGDTVAYDCQILVEGLPDSSTPELGGKYGHELKNIALDTNHKLYVSIASSCNVCVKDTVSNPIRGAIYQYNADGTEQQLFAQGLRNAEGLAFVPGTNNLWVVVNNRDNIAYPHDDGSGNYGKVIRSYVDNHPPEEFTLVREGANYGWPFCNPNPDTPTGLDEMPFDRDYQLNKDGHVDCSKMQRIIKGIPAHSAPLGLTFLDRTRFPLLYQPGVVVALHGSWNRQQKIGYQVIYFPWNRETQRAGSGMTLVSGWLNKETQKVWGRPVDVAVDLQGNLLISDDQSGTLYMLSPLLDLVTGAVGPNTF